MGIKNLKYEIFSGAGNDFVMINNMDSAVPFEKQSGLTAEMCGKFFKKIDGVIFAAKPVNKDASIRMNYFNRDGSYGAMCGNGARCISQFAFDKGLVTREVFKLEAVDKIYKAEILGNNVVRILFPPPVSIKIGLKTGTDFGKGPISVNTNWISTGSEHLVIFIAQNEKTFNVKGLDEIQINEWGRKLRFHKDFQPAGVNVNFVQVLSGNEIRVRTYERGVERETLACGTGIVSSAIISNLSYDTKPPVKVLSQSGEWLTVDFSENRGMIENLTLEGSAMKIGKGEISFDELSNEVVSQK